MSKPVGFVFGLLGGLVILTLGWGAVRVVQRRSPDVRTQVLPRPQDRSLPQPPAADQAVPAATEPDSLTKRLQGPTAQELAETIAPVFQQNAEGSSR